jgi:uncharacterized protein (TIGR02996 family)
VSEEAAFIEALTRDTLDDVTRGVYADWLEERGDPRAAFLRAETALSRLADGDPRWFEVAAAVPREGVDQSWAGVVAPRWDLWLVGYHPYRKINAIKVIRELTGMGLAEAKDFSEGLLPARVQGSYDSSHAHRAGIHLREACGAAGQDVELRRSSAPLFVGWVGPWQPPSIPTPTVPAPLPPASVWMHGYPPQNKIELIKRVREMTGMGLAEAKAFVERPLPVCLGYGLSAQGAEALRERFLPWATIVIHGT